MFSNLIYLLIPAGIFTLVYVLSTPWFNRKLQRISSKTHNSHTGKHNV